MRSSLVGGAFLMLGCGGLGELMFDEIAERVVHESKTLPADYRLPPPEGCVLDGITSVGLGDTTAGSIAVWTGCPEAGREAILDQYEAAFVENGLTGLTRSADGISGRYVHAQDGSNFEVTWSAAFTTSDAGVPQFLVMSTGLPDSE